MTFRGTEQAIPAALRERMVGASWHPDPRCPAFEALRLLTLDYQNFAGEVATGQLVVARALGAEVLAIFGRLFAQRFPIARMDLVDVFGGDDDAAMAANNTSAFNFRNVAGTNVLSKHALGLAIDINPAMNPMIIDGVFYPPSGQAYADRRKLRPGMIVRPGPVVALFESHGWEWGGDWKMKDYHHFAKRGVRTP